MKKTIRFIFISLAIALFISVFYFTIPKNAVQTPLTPDNLNFSEYIDLIMEKGNFGNLKKENLRVFSFSIRYTDLENYIGDNSYVSITIIYKNNGKAYQQSFEFDGKVMTIHSRKVITDPDDVPNPTRWYPSLEEFEWMMATVDLDLLSEKPDVDFRMDYLGPTSTPANSYISNGHTVQDYIFTTNGFFHESEITLDTPQNAYHGFDLRIDFTPYRIFFSSSLVEMKTFYAHNEKSQK